MRASGHPVRTAVLTVLAIAVGSTAAGAVQTTWADPAGLCAGNSPCFTTVGAALAEAGPPPAQVLVLPGTYPESVDLATMGSALPGGAPGELSVVSVDAGGQPAPGAVIDPGAPGGPGAGPAVFAVGFPGALTLDGLVVRSPDESGIALLSGTAPALLVRIASGNSPSGNGVTVINQSGDVRLEASTAVLNSGSGFVLGTGVGSVEVESSVADRNDGEGFNLTGPSISVVDARAEANGTHGFLCHPSSAGSTLAVENVEAIANHQTGLVAAPLVAGPEFVSASLDGVSAVSNAEAGILVVGGAVTAAVVTASANGASGAIFSGGSVLLSQAVAVDNGFRGLLVLATDVVVETAAVERNAEDGLVVITETGGGGFSLTDVTASSNGGMGVSAGFSATAFATGALTGVESALNQGGGVGAGADLLTASQVATVENGTSGILLLANQRIEASAISSAGHPEVGIGLGAAEVRLAGGVAIGNRTGFLVLGAEVLIEGSGAIASGPVSGGPFDGIGFVILGDRVEVRDSQARSNEVGWGFLDLDSPVAGSAGQIPAGLGDPEAVRRELLKLLGSLPLPPAPLGGPVLGGPVPQRITVVTSRAEGNADGSMQIALRPGSTMRVSCSDFVDNGSGGLTLLTDQTVDARSNFWGDASGPTHPGNPGGAGDAIRDSTGGFAGTVLYDPFLAAPASPADCPVQGAVEIPALDRAGLVLLALLLAAGALAVLRRCSPAGPASPAR